MEGTLAGSSRPAERQMYLVFKSSGTDARWWMAFLLAGKRSLLDRSALSEKRKETTTPRQAKQVGKGELCHGGEKSLLTALVLFVSIQLLGVPMTVAPARRCHPPCPAPGPSLQIHSTEAQLLWGEVAPSPSHQLSRAPPRLLTRTELTEEDYPLPGSRRDCVYSETWAYLVVGVHH